MASSASAVSRPNHVFLSLHRKAEIVAGRASRQHVNVPGLHLDLLDAATHAGVPLALGRAVPWLSGRGHLNPVVAERAPRIVLDALADMHEALGGDATALASKPTRSPPTPDLVHTVTGGLIEVDEVQHFTTARLLSFDYYPDDVPVGFDVSEYRRLIEHWRVKADRAFAHRISSDFGQPGGRQAQRAYNDALRDLIAPTFTGLPLIRIALPDRLLSGALLTLNSAIYRLWAEEP